MRFFATTTGVSTNNNDITLVTGGALSLGQIVSAGTGTVRLTTAGGVSQTAAMTASALGVHNATAGNVDLTLATNNVVTFAANNAVAGGTVRYTDADALAIGTVTADGVLFTPDTSGVTTNNGTVGLTAAGALTLNQAITTGGGNATLASGAALTISQLVNVGGGTLRLRAAGSVTQSAAITASALGVQTTVVGGNIDLTTTNNVGTFAASTVGGFVSYVDADALAIGTVTADGTFVNTPGIASAGGKVTINSGSLTVSSGITTSNGDATLVSTGAAAINATVSAGTGTVRLTTAGGVSQTAVITASALGVRNATAGNIDLTLAGNNVATFAANNAVAGGTVKYRDADALAIGTVTLDGTLFTPTTPGITTNAADVTLVTGGALSIGQAIVAGTGTVRLTTAGGVSQTAAITASALGVRNSTGGNVDLTLAANNVATFAANNAVAGGTVKYRDADALAIGSVTDDGCALHADDQRHFD